jgi:2-dehydropantoate 2-reductase
VQWGKLLVNLNNALNTLYGGTLRSGLMQRDYRRVLSAQMSEAIGIIHGAGEMTASFGKASPEQTLKILKLPNWLFSIVMNFILKIDESARSSMLDDLEMGRESEIDYLQGTITQLAKDTGQAAPINEAVYKATLQAFERGESPRMSGADMLAFLR